MPHFNIEVRLSTTAESPTEAAILMRELLHKDALVYTVTGEDNVICLLQPINYCAALEITVPDAPEGLWDSGPKQ